MYCKYNITGVINTGNSVTVIADAREYSYEEVTDTETNEKSMQYVDKGMFANISTFFERCPVSDEEIAIRLSGLLNLVKGSRNVIS